MRFYRGEFLMGDIIICIGLIALLALIGKAALSSNKNSDGMMCINGMMYTKVMGNLLIYPRPDEPMTCSIYSYIQKHRDKK